VAVNKHLHYHYSTQLRVDGLLFVVVLMLGLVVVRGSLVGVLGLEANHHAEQVYQ
jgi:hypothetical protein